MYMETKCPINIHISLKLHPEAKAKCQREIVRIATASGTIGEACPATTGGIWSATLLADDEKNPIAANGSTVGWGSPWFVGYPY